MSNILAAKLDCQCGGKNSPMDSVIVPITQELKCMQKLIKRVRHSQMAVLFQREDEMYKEELKARNLAIWHEPDYRHCK
ncbi:uncharacterized protein LOC6735821 [Drosophila simulans]|uniref:GD25081 n=1 Tax=Drosophila simulans TaxID=7240 RepID=B4QI62_DROSI|nr:uncharacterized protein LOC6735821 [Drosophila simulans]EDX08316.1 GD25081 [Drosophila simulans]KMY95966.1 uncharacterized protein Dsimw501_GD25081 [Drosophila simulans]